MVDTFEYRFHTPNVTIIIRQKLYAIYYYFCLIIVDTFEYRFLYL